LSRRLAALDALVVWKAWAALSAETHAADYEGKRRTAFDEADALFAELQTTVAQRGDDALNRPVAALRVTLEQVEPCKSGVERSASRFRRVQTGKKGAQRCGLPRASR
jgi:hypothetical protein